MFSLIEKLKEIFEVENLTEKYSEEYNVLSMMVYEQELNEKAEETRKNITNYFTNAQENKEEK